MPTPAPDRFEDYCTLFDSKFLPQGLCLYRSLEKHAGPFRLWVLCMDLEVESQLAVLALPNLRVIPLREVESERLLAVKPGRSKGEYCWTLTPFIFPAVFARDPEVARVTYLDADLYFFSAPSALLSELEAAGRDVLITEHAYDARYDQSAKSGRFCVQFLTCNRSPGAAKVLDWWAERCLEWCFNRYEEGRFGDQKYLDAWPELFADVVHILRNPGLTLGPWNVAGLGRAGSDPVLYHYHSLRIVHADEVKLYDGYQLDRKAARYYTGYVAELRAAKRELTAKGLPFATLPDPVRSFSRLRRIKRGLVGTVRYASLK